MCPLLNLENGVTMDDITDIRERLVRLETMQNKDLHDAEEWRRTVDIRLEKLNDGFNVLPCRERRAWYESAGRQLKFIWAVMTMITTVLFTTVSLQFKATEELKAEMTLVKKYSYGVNDFVHGKYADKYYNETGH
jgi:hypothetical protein